MVVTAGQGKSGVYNNRRFEDYKSLKQFFQHRRRVDEVHICGNTTTDGAAAEISFCQNVLNYIGANGAVYCRTEADDANQHSKFVQLEYQDSTGAIKTVVAKDMNAANSTTEEAFAGVSDFYRVRRMYSEVESAAGGGKSVIICDADWDGVADTYGEIVDGNTEFALERFFTQPSATCDSYLAKIKVQAASTAAAATDDTYFLEVTFTPRAPTWGAENGTAADITIHYEFENVLEFEPCILLQGGTEVSFKIGDNASAGILFIQAVMVEVYPDS